MFTAGKINNTSCLPCGTGSSLRFLQGISLLALVLLLVGGAALLLDAWLELRRVIRLALFVGWAGIGGGVALFGLPIPLSASGNCIALPLSSPL